MANILVIGAAGGVGTAVTSLLVARGDNVTATVLNADEENQVVSRHRGSVRTQIVDLSPAETALASLRAVVAGMQALHGVAVCAAISPYGPVESTPLETFRRAFELNTLGGVAIFQATIPALRKTKGRLVFISSMAGRAAMPFIGAYVASKYALEGVADVMRREVRSQGVHVSLVEPGSIRTGMVADQLRTVADRIARLDPEEESRYGYLYRAFQKLAGDSYQSTASTAEAVAKVVLQALDAEAPEPRYVAGEDAKQLLGMADAVTDRELDAVFDQMFDAGRKQG